MGSSGMRRKGRRHLPKVGTPAAMDHDVHAHRERALHPFAEDPSRRRRAPGTTVVALGVAVVLAIGVIALILAT
jgi:hypothetical protein